MSIYLVCIYFLIGILAFLAIIYMAVLVENRSKSEKNAIQNLRQKKSTLYIKYDLKTKEIIINSKYSCLNLDISKYVVEICKDEQFINNIKESAKEYESFSYERKDKDTICYFTFFYRGKTDNFTILRCDYNIEKKLERVNIKNIEDIKLVHEKNRNKRACLYYLNVKDFNSINQRYGQKSGDYVLETIKKRLVKLERKNLQCCHLKADQFAIYYNDKRINKKRGMKLIKDINKKLSKSIDVGYINLDLAFGIGVCIGDYDTLDEFVRCSYVASDYAKKRKHYNIVLYNENMKLEEDIVDCCERELEKILKNNDININYNPVFYHTKNKFIGYISNPIFSNEAVNYDSLKKIASQKEKETELIATIINNQLINYLKRRPKKSSKLFLTLKLEDLPIFLEIYLSNSAYSDCKIVVCLNVKKGYEMLNKYSYISATISKIIEEGIEFALEINYSTMYNYDYILKNASYLILDDSIVSNMNNVMAKNRFLNVIELAKNYELELLAVDVKEYIQFENLLKYNVRYFSGSYFGKGARKPNEIEQAKTKIFAKFIKDSKKNKKD